MVSISACHAEDPGSIPSASEIFYQLVAGCVTSTVHIPHIDPIQALKLTYGELLSHI